MGRKYTPSQTVVAKSSCPWYEEELDLDELRVYRGDANTRGYQRPLSQAFIDHIIENKLDLSECRSIFVSRRTDGTMWVLDGQHTREILLATGITRWPCRVFEGLTPQQEARRFVEYQENSRRLSPIAKWQAEWAGGVQHVVEIERILAAHGIRIATTTLRSIDGLLSISARDVMERIYKLGGEELLNATLEVAKDSWGFQRSSFYSRTLMGVAYYLAHVDKPVDRKRLLSVLGNTTTKQIAEDAGAVASYAGGAGRSAAQVVAKLYALGVPGQYGPVRLNGKQTPRLPEKVRGEEIEPHDHELFT